MRWLLWWRLLQAAEDQETIHKVSLQWRFQVHETNRSSSQVRMQSQVLVHFLPLVCNFDSHLILSWMSLSGRNNFLIGPQLRQAASLSRHPALPCVPIRRHKPICTSPLSFFQSLLATKANHFLYMIQFDLLSNLYSFLQFSISFWWYLPITSFSVSFLFNFWVGLFILF